MAEKENENLIDKVVEAVDEAVSTIVQGIESILSPEKETPEPVAAPTTEPEKPVRSYTRSEPKTQEIESSDAISAETRIGYVAANSLPQGEEPEEEAAIESDAKNEIEIAIAKARETAAESEAEKRDPLVAETLPDLPRKNSAKLYLQSPNRIFVYWSLTGNPYETLRKALGRRADAYQLVSKLVNLDTFNESFAPAEYAGNWWFNVRSASRYRVDLGFYAANRPFIRLLSSNALKTPRATPSQRAATEADWIVSTRQFVEVLTNSGYERDVFNVVFDVAFDADQKIGETSDETSTLAAANRFAALTPEELDLSELRWALVALAAGVNFADLRAHVSNALAAWLDNALTQNQNALTTANVRAVLADIFGTEFVETIAEQPEFVFQKLAPVVGASAIHIPEIRFPKISTREANKFKNPFANQDFPVNLETISSQEFVI